MSSTSPELKKAINTAEKALEKNKDSHLELGFRQQIWKALGPRLTKNNRAVFGIGLQQRTALAIECAKKVLPIWQQQFSKDDSPQKMIELAKIYFVKKMNFDVVWNQKNKFLGYLESDLAEEENRQAVSAGFAAARALSTAMYDEEFDEKKIDEKLKDSDRDPYEWDASFYASLSFANGATWEKQSDNKKRKEFWEWYLKTAQGM